MSLPEASVQPETTSSLERLTMDETDALCREAFALYRDAGADDEKPGTHEKRSA